MPTSALELAPASVHLVWETKPKRILDIGCGAGTYGVLLRAFLEGPPRVDGCEAWEPYFATYHLTGIYDQMYAQDATTLDDATLALYDTVFMGDVLEHIAKDDALALLARIPGWVVINTPLLFFHNGEGLPHTEAHVSHWDKEDFQKTGRLDYYEVRLQGQLVRLTPH
jgi:SAM-dependent methyltransferase